MKKLLELGDHYVSDFIKEDSEMEGRTKYSLDLYSFGLILYGVLEHNTYIHYDSKYYLYQDFVNKIYKYENAKQALIDFQSII
jgi:hypothetical protein